MNSKGLANGANGAWNKVTRRGRFLALMHQVVPWERLRFAIEPHWPENTDAQAPTRPIDQLLRLYFLQHWYSLGDEALEDAVHDSIALRQFAGLELLAQPLPVASSISAFRQLLRKQRLDAVLLTEMNLHLSRQGLRMKRGAIFEANLFSASI